MRIFFVCIMSADKIKVERGGGENGPIFTKSQQQIFAKPTSKRIAFCPTASHSMTIRSAEEILDIQTALYPHW